MCVYASVCFCCVCEDVSGVCAPVWGVCVCQIAMCVYLCIYVSVCAVCAPVLWYVWGGARVCGVCVCAVRALQAPACPGWAAGEGGMLVGAAALL